MLTISDEAAALIRRLIEESDLPDSAGLRLGTDDDLHSLAMQLVPEPGPHDVVLAKDGASLFVSPMASVRVGGQTLRAQVEGRPAFFVD